VPKKGWKAITVKEELADVLEKEGKEAGRSVPEQIEFLTERAHALQVDEESREEYRCTLAGIAEELKAKNPGVPAGEIRDWLKKLLDVTV
jgi:hypothetical protein